MGVVRRFYGYVNEQAMWVQILFYVAFGVALGACVWFLPRPLGMVVLLAWSFSNMIVLRSDEDEKAIEEARTGLKCIAIWFAFTILPGLAIIGIMLLVSRCQGGIVGW